MPLSSYAYSNVTNSTFTVAQLFYPNFSPFPLLPRVCQFVIGPSPYSVTNDSESGFFNLNTADGNPTLWSGKPYISPTSTASQPTTSTTTYTRPTTTESSGSTLISTQPTATVTDSSLASGPSLSRAGKIGVGIGVPLAFLAIVTVLLFLILRIKRSRSRNQEWYTGQGFEKPELANTQIESFGPTELPISPIGKIFANNVAELEATGPSPNVTHGNAT
jgi:hypothetical protein